MWVWDRVSDGSVVKEVGRSTRMNIAMCGGKGVSVEIGLFSWCGHGYEDLTETMYNKYYQILVTRCDHI